MRLFVFLLVAGATAAAHAQPAPDYKLVDNHLKLPGPVLFEAGSDRLKPESDDVLKFIAGFLNAKTYLTTVRIACGRIMPVGFGSTKPLVPNDTPDNKAQNRRIDVFPAAMNGRAIGGKPVDGGGRVAGDPCR